MKKSAAFAILIKKLRLEHGLSGEQLAKLINVSQQQISRYEREVTELKLAQADSSPKCNAKPPFLAPQTPPKVV